MTLSASPHRHRFPASIISQAVWMYHRFNNSYRDVEEQLAFRGINVSHETVRSWCLKILLQKHRNKKAAIRFLIRLLGSYPAPRIMVTDKLKSYKKPVQIMCRQTEHRTHKRLNNRAENAHQPTRRKEKCLIKFKSPRGTQTMLSLMGKVRNIFAIDVGRYTKNATERKIAFASACAIWFEASHQLLCV